jgi:hypothetical protein
MQFHCQWHHSKGRLTQSDPVDIKGLWSGSWESSTTNHGGKLRCVIRKTSPNSYSFHYRATWARIISGNFKINCTVTRDNEKWLFSGAKNLGILGGKFSHSGNASLNEIQAIYHSEQGDEGTFELHRAGNQ